MFTLNELHAQLDTLDVRISRLQTEHDRMQSRVAAIAGNDLNSILALLAEDGDAEIPDVEQEVGRIGRELFRLYQARGLLVARLDEARAVEHKKRNEAARPRYRESVKRVAAVMVELGKAAAEEKAARAALGEPVACVFHRLDFYDLADGYSPLRSVLRELVQRGYLDAAQERALRGVPEAPAEAPAGGRLSRLVKAVAGGKS